MASSHAIARKYAEALFALAQERNEVRACQQGLDEMARIVRLRASLTQVLNHPFIAADEKQRMVKAALGEYSTPLLEQFFERLIRSHRFTALPEIVKEFQMRVDQAQGVESLRVQSAYALSEAQQKQLQTALEEYLKTKVRLETQVDPSLIGGLVIHARGGVIDQSLKGRLNKLERQLI